jgi:hypothetical protein
MSYISRLATPALLMPRKERLRTSVFTTDAQMSFDQATIDSAGVFLIGELEKLDPKLHMPLTSVSWPRDIDLREDVTIADEVSSYTNSAFAAPGGMQPTGKAWISNDTTTIPGISLDIGKTPQPLHLWGMEMRWSLPELYSAQQLGRPIDSQKLEGLKLKHNMDVDEMVYIGDATKNAAGLCNSPKITPINVINGASGSPLWSTKTPDEVLNDINTLISNTWTNSAVSVVPSEVRLPPLSFSYLASTKVSSAGNTTVLEFVREKSISSVINNKPLNIQPLKWLSGRGVGGTNRMMAYSRNSEYIRYPMVPLQRTPLEWRGIHQITTYFGRLGELEIPYAETIGYMDGF